MKNIKICMVTAVGCMFCFSLIGAGAWAKDPDRYVIGGMHGLSGPAYSVVIDNIVKGGNLAVEEINEKGGIDGKKMELIWEDHKGKGPEAVAAFNKLISIDHVPVATIGFTASIMACAPIADQKRVLLINQGAYGPALSGAGKYLFHIPANELVLIRGMLDYGKKNLKVKSLGLIHVNDDMGLSVKEFLTEFCDKIGIKFVGSEAFDFAATDFSLQIEKARQWRADAIYASLQRQPALIKQAYEKGWTPQWIGCPLFTFPEYLTQGSKGMDGAISGAADVGLERNPKLTKVRESWERKYGKDSWPKGGANQIGYTYDYPYIVKSLIEYGKKKGWEDYWSGEKLRQALLEIRSFDGCMGRITLDPKTGLSSRNIQIFKAVDNPEQKGTYIWKEVAFYSADQVETVGGK